MHTSSKPKKKQRLPKTSAKIAIIGTGPAALSTALSLQQAGFTDIALYERDKDFNARKDGYGLTLTYNPSNSIHSPLQKLGILEELARRDCPSRSHYVFNSQGKILGYYGNAFSNEIKGLGQRGNLRVPRQVLRQVMMDTLLERDRLTNHICIHWGRKLKSYEQKNTKSCVDGDGDDCVNENGRREKPVILQFEDGGTTDADLLVGADGVRSVVVQKLLRDSRKGNAISAENEKDESNSTKTGNYSAQNAELSYTGIMIILGITKDFYHPLMDERGFYTLDGNYRLFTMPFEGSRIHDLEEYNVPIGDMSTGNKRSRRYMWQLSFNLDYEDALVMSKSGPQGIIDEVLKRTKNWHEPVQDMIRSTPLYTVWGTPLVDRNPKMVLNQLKHVYQCSDSRVLVMGDAAHSMTPFKGQGCNQSLMDGPLLSSWLEKSNISSSISGFFREMVQRTHKKVSASREAAKFLHSDDVLSHKESFAGVEKDSVELLLKELSQRSIGAHLGGQLDSHVANVIEELDVSDEKDKNGTSTAIRRDERLEHEALKLAGDGDLAGIRKLSMTSPESIRDALDSETGDTCLHLAARVGCYHTVKWLLSEVSIDYTILNKKKKSALYEATIGCNDQVTILLAKISKLKI